MSISFYKDDHEFQITISEIQTSPKITFTDKDTFTAASHYENAACLNFASHKRPGGGYLSVIDLKAPIKTQEEDLFRRSNLPELMDNDMIRACYPLKEAEGLYCPGVIVSKDKNLDPIKPFTTSVVTIPAVVNPGMNKLDLVKRRARRIFEIAADNQHTTLILGAWGCGVFNNDPQTIAELFKKLITKELFGFSEVVFAIPNKQSQNYKIFEEICTK